MLDGKVKAAKRQNRILTAILQKFDNQFGKLLSISEKNEPDQDDPLTEKEKILENLEDGETPIGNETTLDEKIAGLLIGTVSEEEIEHMCFSEQVDDTIMLR